MLVGRMVAPKTKRIFKDGGREATMFLMSMMILIFPTLMRNFPAGYALVDLASMW
jgi:hypothetical protein